MYFLQDQKVEKIKAGKCSINRTCIVLKILNKT